ncbi:hypothetical protein OROGR_014726 [Orobanche gracilis]
MILKDVHWTVNEAWRRICADHDEFIKFCCPNVGDEGVFMGNHWAPPPRGSLKVNTDGSCYQETSRMGGGGVVRDEHGHWILGFASQTWGGTAFMAEITALRDGLEMVWNRGYRHVIFETDCEEILQALNDAYIVQLMPIVREGKPGLTVTGPLTSGRFLVVAMLRRIGWQSLVSFRRTVLQLFNRIFDLQMAMKPLTSEAIALTEKKMDMTLDDIIKMSQTHGMKPKTQRVSNKGQKFVNKVSQDNSLKVRRFMDTRSSIRQGALAQRRSNFQANQFPLATEAAKKAAVAPIRGRAFNRTRRFNVNKRVGSSTVRKNVLNEDRFTGKVSSFLAFVTRLYYSAIVEKEKSTLVMFADLRAELFGSASKGENLSNSLYAFVLSIRSQVLLLNVVIGYVQKPAQVANGGDKQKPQTLDSLFATMKEERMRAISRQNNNGSRINGVVPWARGYQHN